ncbi:DUF2293 domain-containing protein [candidate division KSB1 bacterium]|nr:DUF2293 domain-containing protein [candidate division KSB1 bacterium]
MQKKSNDILVFISSKEGSCGECQSELASGAWITLDQEKGALCLSCADLDHLEFLPSGDPALTRRSKKYSKLYAVVLRWSKRRKRYERQGLLVELEAIEKAEQECLADQEIRERRRERDALRREELDVKYIKEFATKIEEHYPSCPPGKAKIIAEHACQKYSGRVGRTAAAKSFSEKMIELAVLAHIRHAETQYDDLLLSGVDRWEARERVEMDVLRVLEYWQRQD